MCAMNGAGRETATRGHAMERITADVTPPVHRPRDDGRRSQGGQTTHQRHPRYLQERNAPALDHLWQWKVTVLCMASHCAMPTSAHVTIVRNFCF